MQKYKVAAIMLLIGTVAGAALFPEAYAQETPDLEFEFSQSQIIILGIGALGGLTVAYQGWSKSRKQQHQEIVAGRSTVELKFDPTRFLNRVIYAVIPAIPIAIASAAQQSELDLYAIVTIYMATIGASTVISGFRSK